MEPLLIIFFAILPAFIFLWLFIVLLDMRTDYACIWYGFVGGFGVYFLLDLLYPILGFLIPPPSDLYAYAAYISYLEAALLEEATKFLVGTLVLWWVAGPIKERDIVLVFLSVSCGYAAIENMGYFDFGEWYETALARTLTATPGHAFTGLVMGVLWYEATRRPSFLPYGLLALAVPIALHGTYNFSIFVQWELWEAEETLSYTTYAMWEGRFLLAMGLEWMVAHLLILRFIRTYRPTWRVDMRPFPSIGWYLFNALVHARGLWIGLATVYYLFGAGVVIVALMKEEPIIGAYGAYAILHGVVFHLVARRLKRQKQAMIITAR